MFWGKEEYSYKLILPASTLPEVLEWFKDKDAMNTLSKELIELVLQHINSRAKQADNDIFEQISDQISISNSIDKNLIDSLYNWQDSNNAVFKEEKKKMLSV